MVRTRSQVKRLVTQYVQNLETRGIRVQTVVLFGSYARKAAHVGSDIDIAVIAPQFARLNIRERYETLGMANMELRAPIQAIGYAPRQWRYCERGSFIDEIQRTGQIIYRRTKKPNRDRVTSSN
jgi:predicted nucleotidyltransferase